MKVDGQSDSDTFSNGITTGKRSVTLDSTAETALRCGLTPRGAKRQTRTREHPWVAYSQLINSCTASPSETSLIDRPSFVCSALLGSIPSRVNIVAARSAGDTGRSTGYSACASVLPTTVPRLIPPPATRIELARGQ